jgi:hypothetical protein
VHSVAPDYYVVTPSLADMTQGCLIIKQVCVCVPAVLPDARLYTYLQQCIRLARLLHGHTAFGLWTQGCLIFEQVFVCVPTVLPDARLCTYLYIRVPICVPLYLTVYLSIHLCTYLCTSLPNCVPISIAMCVTISAPVCDGAFFSIRLSQPT